MTGSAEAWAAGVETLAYRGRDPLEVLTAELAAGRPAWMAEAACRGLGTDLFFGHGARAGVKVCAACPVRADCAKWGAAEEFGLWGGRQRGAEMKPPQAELACVVCGEPSHCRGHCKPHYEALRRRERRVARAAAARHVGARRAPQPSPAP